MTQFVIKRIYEPANPNDGYRVLVDRLWPRGVSKERAALDEWAKDIAPSTHAFTRYLCFHAGSVGFHGCEMQ